MQSPRGVLAHHEYADLFPLLGGDELKALAQDIKVNGLRVPIVLHEGKILDGRNRYRACKMAKVKPRFERFKGTVAEALAFVVSLNVTRRHLTVVQRAALAVSLLPVERELAQQRMLSGRRNPPLNLEEGQKGEAAQLAGVRLGISRITVRQAVDIAERAPDVIEAMTEGTISSMPEALRVSGIPVQERKAVLRRMERDGSKVEEALTAIRTVAFKRRSRRNTPREIHQPRYRLIYGRHVIDALRDLPDASVHMVATSPPYWGGQRDYGLPAVRWADGWRGQLGHEPSVDQYVQHLVEVFSEVRRVLRPDATLWLNLGDSFSKAQDLA